MSGSQQSRPTVELSIEDIAKLVKDDATPKAAPRAPTRAPGRPIEKPPQTEQTIARSRRNTIEDPLTTQLLAEVARARETLEFEAEVIAEAVETLGPQERSHPNTRRRSR